MNEDDYNERLLMAHLDEQDTYDELIEEEKELILSNLVVGDVEDFYLLECLESVQDELVESLAKNENDKVLAILHNVFNDRIFLMAKEKVDNM
jgi:hypothetical protein